MHSAHRASNLSSSKDFDEDSALGWGDNIHYSNWKYVRSSKVGISVLDHFALVDGLFYWSIVCCEKEGLTF